MSRSRSFSSSVSCIPNSLVDKCSVNLQNVQGVPKKRGTCHWRTFWLSYSKSRPIFLKFRKFPIFWAKELQYFALCFMLCSPFCLLFTLAQPSSPKWQHFQFLDSFQSQKHLEFGKSSINSHAEACVMEIEKEVDWLAEKILAYGRGLRLWWPKSQP